MSQHGLNLPNRGVVGNGPRMVARGCQGSPEVPVGLKRGLQTAPEKGGAANGQIRRNRGSPPPHQYWGRRHGAAIQLLHQFDEDRCKETSGFMVAADGGPDMVSGRCAKAFEKWNVFK